MTWSFQTIYKIKYVILKWDYCLLRFPRKVLVVQCFDINCTEQVNWIAIHSCALFIYLKFCGIKYNESVILLISFDRNNLRFTSLLLDSRNYVQMLMELVQRISFFIQKFLLVCWRLSWNMQIWNIDWYLRIYLNHDILIISILLTYNWMSAYRVRKRQLFLYMREL